MRKEFGRHHPESDAIAMFRMVLAEGRSLTRQRNAIEARSIELLVGLDRLPTADLVSPASVRSTR